MRRSFPPGFEFDIQLARQGGWLWPLEAPGFRPRSAFGRAWGPRSAEAPARVLDMGPGLERQQFRSGRHRQDAAAPRGASNASPRTRRSDPAARSRWRTGYPHHGPEARQAAHQGPHQLARLQAYAGYHRLTYGLTAVAMADVGLGPGPRAEPGSANSRRRSGRGVKRLSIARRCARNCTPGCILQAGDVEVRRAFQAQRLGYELARPERLKIRPEPVERFQHIRRLEAHAATLIEMRYGRGGYWLA